MAKTDTGRSVRVFVPPMIQRGAILGLALALSEWFLVSFDVATLGVGFTVFGIVLALYGDRSWVDVG